MHTYNSVLGVARRDMRLEEALEVEELHAADAAELRALGMLFVACLVGTLLTAAPMGAAPLAFVHLQAAIASRGLRGGRPGQLAPVHELVVI